MKRRACVTTFIPVAIAFLLPSIAHAYVGPGLGITLLGSLWAVVAALVLAIGGILYWPIKALTRRARRAKTASPQAVDSKGAGEMAGQ